MTLAFFTIPTEVYAIPGLDEIQRAVLGLAMTLPEVRVSDGELAGLFGKSTRWINGRIRDLKERGFITVDKGQSRYRTIRLLGSPEVPSRSEPTKKSEVPSRSGESRSLLGSPEVPPTRKSRGSDINKKNIAHTPALDETFEQFWKAYPRRIGKDAARKAWGRLNPNGELPAIIAAAATMARRAEAGDFDGPRGRMQFCPHGATWLNNRRWEDEPDKTAGANGETDWSAYNRAAADLCPLPTEAELEARPGYKESMARIRRAGNG